MYANDTALKATLLPVLQQQEQFAETFYQHLFTLDPSIQTLFARTEMRLQHAKLILMLAMIFSNLNDPKSLALRLQDLGRRHTYYHVKQDHYAQCGHAFLKTFADYLGTSWTSELEARWMQAYQSILQMMNLDHPTEGPLFRTPEAHALRCSTSDLTTACFSDQFVDCEKS
jgi:hemoglobin-like flavoprotein